MVDFNNPGIDQFGGQGGYSGSGGHDCPTGKHWDAQKMTCVDDIQVGNKPDGHTYDIQKAENVTGLIWDTLFTLDNATDANKNYDASVAGGGYWQMLVDGKMTKTNLPIDQRYDAVEDQKAKDYLKHEYSCEYKTCESCEWSWFATATTLDEAKADVKAAQEGTAFATISYGHYQIRDWNGVVVWSQVIDAPTPPAEPGTPSQPVDVENSMNALMVGVVVVLLMAMSAYMLQGGE